MILHYSLAIWKINDNALSLIFFVNAQRSGQYILSRIFEDTVHEDLKYYEQTLVH